MAIQAFLMNAFGSLDNLAWILVFEKNVKGKKGKGLSKVANLLLDHLVCAGRVVGGIVIGYRNAKVGCLEAALEPRRCPPFPNVRRTVRFSHEKYRTR